MIIKNPNVEPRWKSTLRKQQISPVYHVITYQLIRDVLQGRRNSTTKHGTFACQITPWRMSKSKYNTWISLVHTCHFFTTVLELDNAISGEPLHAFIIICYIATCHCNKCHLADVFKQIDIQSWVHTFYVWVGPGIETTILVPTPCSTNWTT